MSNNVKIVSKRPITTLKKGDIVEHVWGIGVAGRDGAVEHYILTMINHKYVAVCLQDGGIWDSGAETIEQAVAGMNIRRVLTNCDIELHEQPVTG